MPIDRLIHLRGRRYGGEEPVRYVRQSNFSLHPVLVIIAVNVIVFIATLILGKVYITYGDIPIGVTYKVNYYLGLIPAVFGERPWTIISNMFAHGGFWHIFANMLVLYFFGNYLARIVGEGKFLFLYFVGGIVANALYLLMNLSSYIPMVGASGAIYALAGALVVLRPKLKVLLYFIVPMPLWLAVLFFMVIWSFVPGVAWQAHLGGLIAGLIIGYFFRRGQRYYYFR